MGKEGMSLKSPDSKNSENPPNEVEAKNMQDEGRYVFSLFFR